MCGNFKIAHLYIATLTHLTLQSIHNYNNTSVSNGMDLPKHSIINIVKSESLIC